MIFGWESELSLILIDWKLMGIHMTFKAIMRMSQSGLVMSCLPTICTSREAGLILHWAKRQRWVYVFGFTMPRRERQERNTAWERVWTETKQ